MPQKKKIHHEFNGLINAAEKKSVQSEQSVKSVIQTKGWEIKKLGDCFKLKSGEMLTAKMMRSEGVFPVYGGNGISGLHDKFNLSGSSVIVGRVGALCGNVRHINEKIWLTDNGFQAVDFKYEFDHAFLTYLLNFKNLRSLARQAAQPVISNSSLTELVLEFPKFLSEQEHIVSILDECFEAINQAKTNTEKNLNNAKELFQSELNKIFLEKKMPESGLPELKDEQDLKKYKQKKILKSSNLANPDSDNEGVWMEKKLVDITTVLGDGLHGTPKYTDKGEYYFVNGNNLKEGSIVFKENTKRVSVEEFHKYKKNLTNRTILVSINGTLGNIAFYNDEKIILGKSACYFNLIDWVDKHFMKYVFYSPYFQNYAEKEATGATIKNVSLKSMREFKIFLPSLKTQQKIVSQLNTLSAETKKLESIYQKKLNELEELKKSILQKAFSAELVKYKPNE